MLQIVPQISFNTDQDVRFSIRRPSHLFRAFISVPDEAAAAIATLRIHRRVYIWTCWYVGHMWSVFVLLSDRTCSLLMISDLVMATRSPSSTAKAGKEMTDRRPASISFEVEARGSMEHRMDWGKTHGHAEQEDSERRAMQRCLEVKVTIPDSAPPHRAKRGWLTSALREHRRDPARLWPPEPPVNRPDTHRSTHTSMNLNTSDTTPSSLLFNVQFSLNTDINRLNLYLSDSDRAAIELGDALVGLVTSLPHPIILQEERGHDIIHQQSLQFLQYLITDNQNGSPLIQHLQNHRLQDWGQNI